MLRGAALLTAGRCVGAVLGCLAKQVVVIRGLESVRKEIEVAVSFVARQRFGQWVGSAVGLQASMMLQLPVTSLLGDLVWTNISYLVETTFLIGARASGALRSQVQRVSTTVALALQVSAISCGYFAKYCITQTAAPAVKLFLEKVLSTALPWYTKHILSAPLSTRLIASYAITATPVVTVIIADIAAFMITEAIVYSAKHAIFSLRKRRLSVSSQTPPPCGTPPAHSVGSQTTQSKEAKVSSLFAIPFQYFPFQVKRNYYAQQHF